MFDHVIAGARTKGTGRTANDTAWASSREVGGSTVASGRKASRVATASDSR